MKKLYFLILGGGKVKISYLLLAFLFATTTAATAEVLLNENFEYEEGNLYGQGKDIDSTKLGWIRYGTHTGNPIQVVEGALSYIGYQENAIGKAAKITSGSATDEDLQIAFSNAPIVSKSIYAAMLVKITDAGQGEQPAYFAAFTGKTNKGWVDGVNATDYGRIFSIKSEEEGKFKFGISKNNANPSITTENLNLGETYLLVLKYEFIDDTNNDIASLWVNPTDFKNEPSTTLIGTITQGDVSTTNGLQAIEIRQGQTFNRLTPTMAIDAIRVATTWAELFPSATTDPDPKKPVISAPESIKFGSSYYVLTGESYDVKIAVKGTDLEDDVTFASTCDQVTLSAASATKEQVMSADGFELTLTLKATGATCDPKLQIASTNAPAVEVPIAWMVLPTIDVADLAELRAQAATVNLEDGPAFRITNPVVVSYQDGDNYIYLQDDKGGIRMKDERGVVSATALPTGTKIAAGLLGTVSNNFGYEFIPYRDINTDGTAEVNAVTATLAEIDADKAAYADRLVRIEHVKFANSGQKFGTSQETFSQNGIDAKLRKLASVTDIAGQDIPAQATVVGISTSTSTLLIAPRGWSDITVESSTVAIDKATIATNCYTQAGMLIVENATTDIAVYNLTGICVAKAAAMPYASFTLPQGVYAVKMNGQTCKVVVK